MSSRHGTLSASSVATVTLAFDSETIPLAEGVNIYDTSAGRTRRRGVSHAEVVNVTGSAAIYFTTNGTTPTVEGDDTHVVPAAAGASLKAGASKNDDGDVVVKLISSGTPKYSVEVG